MLIVFIIILIVLILIFCSISSLKESLKTGFFDQLRSVDQCSVPCGSGSEYANVYCGSVDTQGNITPVDNSYCINNVGPNPNIKQIPCNTQSCDWNISPLSGCDCSGNQSKDITCPFGDDSLCPSPKPTPTIVSCRTENNLACLFSQIFFNPASFQFVQRDNSSVAIQSSGSPGTLIGTNRTQASYFRLYMAWEYNPTFKNYLYFLTDTTSSNMYVSRGWGRQGQSTLNLTPMTDFYQNKYSQGYFCLRIGTQVNDIVALLYNPFNPMSQYIYINGSIAIDSGTNLLIFTPTTTEVPSTFLPCPLPISTDCSCNQICNAIGTNCNLYCQYFQNNDQNCINNCNNLNCPCPLPD